jgi:hypothetical protein
MPYFILIVALIASALPIRNYDPELSPYIHDYLNLVNKVCKSSQYNYPDKTRASFAGKLNEPSWVGQCVYNDDFWAIDIVYNSWKQMSEKDKRELMYHELTHCVLKQKHVETNQNYMYYMMIDIEPRELEDQVMEAAWNHCGQN